MSKVTAGEAQQRHYEAIHDAYEAHYFDPASMAYRERFIYSGMFEGLDLNGKLVADLAAASGYNSVAMLKRFPAAQVMGFDISPKACAAYEGLVGSRCVQFDLTRGEDPGVRVDAAMVVGGIHHCVADLPSTFETLAQLIKPGGMLLATEPNRSFFLERLRQHWYRADKYFDADTERALDYEELDALARDAFEPVDVRYMGGPGYFLILNSLVTRTPLAVKRMLAPPMFLADAIYNRLPGKQLFPYFIARWRRR